MTKDAPGLFWAVPLSLNALLHRGDFRKSVETYWQEPLSWRWAEARDWPPQQTLFSDFGHAREGGYGFVTETGSKRLFLVPRGWNEPEWALGETNLVDGRWRNMGNIEPASPIWVLPELSAHPSRSSAEN